MGGPLSMGFPEPLNMRPSMSSDTGVFKTFKYKAIQGNEYLCTIIMHLWRVWVCVLVIFPLSTKGFWICSVMTYKAQCMLMNSDETRHLNFRLHLRYNFENDKMNWDHFMCLLNNSQTFFQKINILNLWSSLSNHPTSAPVGVPNRLLQKKVLEEVVLSTSPVNCTVVNLLSIPDVPSKTWKTKCRRRKITL